MTPELQQLTARLDHTQARLERAERRARVSGTLALAAVGLTLTLNVRPAALATVATPGTSLTSLLARLSAAETHISTNTQDITTQGREIEANKASIGTLQTNAATDESNIKDLKKNQASDEGHISALQTLTQPLTLSGTDLTIAGVNVHIIDGTGSTNSVAGLGNLIIGYNALGNTHGDTRTGSHNLILGDQNSYSSYGGIVAGFNDAIGAQYASVTGGDNNAATGPYSSVTGGNTNQAAGFYAAVTGGFQNVAGPFSNASGDYTTVNGGFGNIAAGQYSTVSGGHSNNAGGTGSTIGGGYQYTIDNTTADEDEWAAGVNGHVALPLGSKLNLIVQH